MVSYSSILSMLRMRLLSLNPCCSGRWSRTFGRLQVGRHVQRVLILVVVDNGLVRKDMV